MSQSAQGCCNQEAICHMAKGTGYFFGASGATLALITVAAVVAGIAIGLFIWDGFFIYNIGLRSTASLIWAIPVTLAFVAVDLLIIMQIGNVGLAAGSALAKGIKHCGDKMLEHYRAVDLTAEV